VGVYFIPVVVGLGAPHGMLAREELAHGGSLVTTAAVQVNELVEARDEEHLLPRVS
jgi:glycerol kinase